MTKAEVIDILEQKHQTLYEWLVDHPDENWIKGPEGKWNTGEHIVHLIQSEKALNKALRLPKFYLKYKLGTNNRDNRTYDQIVKRYQERLADNPGVVANTSKNMPPITVSNKASYLSELDKEKKRLIKKFQNWTEHDLDTYLLPHPLMGRMTVREIVIWTAYHTEHHYNNLRSNY
ncbi:DinB family protein [Roseivirga sp. E12]|uniref:DinB family protein n=1 Tax=Roseivirga sp. E12 TaxID=2819237 RepID=UPI001ABC9CE6|nr:DinB family protein [Roseivirga sp. E12]MBO3696832.1 DinB family protein [Roseivirga sp. E12]